ncbi:putative MCM-type protein [Armadillidium vulgare]|nr:putative MCM-type protein [Armadillidium vulgare]
MENIGLQDSLLSRFDCLFIMLDNANAESDRMISDHVVRMHRFRAANEQDGDILPFGPNIDVLSTNKFKDNDEEETTEIYEKYDAMLHGKSRSKLTITARALETLIRLATAHAKARLSRTVSQEDAEAAIELVQYAYFKKVLEKKKVRNQGETDTESELEDEVEEAESRKKRKRTPEEEDKTQKKKKTSDGKYKWFFLLT